MWRQCGLLGSGAASISRTSCMSVDIVPAGDGFNHASAEDANVDAVDRGGARRYRTARAVSRGEELLPATDPPATARKLRVCCRTILTHACCCRHAAEGDHGVETRRSAREVGVEARPTVGRRPGRTEVERLVGCRRRMAWLEKRMG